MTRALGPRRPGTVAVVGVDASDTMLAEARRRTVDRRSRSSSGRGDITRLELDDRAFDGVYCERVFQHLERRRRAHRRARPSDHGPAAGSSSSTPTGACTPSTAPTRRSPPESSSRWAAVAANGWSGRRLPALFADAGLPNRSSSPRRSPAPTRADRRGHPSRPWPAAAQPAGAITADEAAAWLAQLADAGGQRLVLLGRHDVRRRRHPPAPTTIRRSRPRRSRDARQGDQPGDRRAHRRHAEPPPFDTPATVGDATPRAHTPRDEPHAGEVDVDIHRGTARIVHDHRANITTFEPSTSPTTVIRSRAPWRSSRISRPGAVSSRMDDNLQDGCETRPGPAG